MLLGDWADMRFRIEDLPLRKWREKHAAAAQAAAAQADMIRDLVPIDEVRALIERTR